MDLGFDRALEHRTQEVEAGGDVHILLAQRDPACHAAAAEIETIAVPTVLYAKLFVHPFGDLLDSGARIFHAAFVGIMDVDAGHGPILRSARRAC